MQLCFLFHITIFEVTDRLTHLLQKLYKYSARYYDMMLLVDIKYYVFTVRTLNADDYNNR